MKHNLLAALLLTFLFLPSFAQLNCDYIDPICQKARELMNQGQYDKALKGLKIAKSAPGIRNCSDAYKIDNMIPQIQKKQAFSASQQSYLACPDSNHPHLIDLGLPSGTKWACCNVGATCPEDYGNYYAWGETMAKNTYDWSTYKWCRGEFSTLTKYCTQSSYGIVDNKTVLDLSDDAACANWGDSWRMTTLAQFLELLYKSIHVWTTVNGVSGRKFTGPNGASIFLPAAGWCYEADLYSCGTGGYYWSSMPFELGPSNACLLNFYHGYAICNDQGRRCGHSVRPVAAIEVHP